MTLRPEPTKTLDGLRPPAAGFPYFAHADRFPLDVTQPNYAPRNASWLADACLLSYGNVSFIQREFANTVLPQLSWRLDWLGDPDDLAGIVLRSPHACVIAFRGTRQDVHQLFEGAELILLNPDDLFTDSQFLPSVDGHGGRVHTGFLRSFENLKPALESLASQIGPEVDVVLTGHSLGAALATLAAAYLRSLRAKSLYTFGSPRVGDERFASELSDQLHHRVVCGADWISQAPPEFLGYVHTGNLIAIPKDPNASFSTQLTRTFEGVRSVFGTLTQQRKLDMGDWELTLPGLIDHSPIMYATRLWNTLWSKHASGERV